MQTKITKQFLINEETNFVCLGKFHTYCAVLTKSVKFLGLKLGLHKIHHTTCKIVFCCGVLENGFQTVS